MIDLRGQCFAALVFGLAMASAAEVAAPTATAGVDRPAIWIADRVTYTVEIVCPRGVDILTGDLDRDKLKLTGLEVLSADSRRRSENDAARYTFDYVLTTYRVDVATPAIGAFQVRYYLTGAGQRPEDAAPAGAVTIPAVPIAFRSLLADEQTVYEPRADRPLSSPSLPYTVLAPAGIGLMLVSATPLAFLVVRFATAARARRRDRAGPSARQAKQAARAALDELRALDASEPRARREGFARLDALVRGHLAAIAGVPADGMTVDEIVSALDGRTPQVPVQLLTSVLGSCELARFASPDLHPSLDAWRDAVAEAEQIVSGR
jgi:hypothetical protein